ncbi:MAG TPA: FKBP-type peptidyl-prolyl cis-trans isomerase [Cyclobacteriaceae bacterium]|nr:FKBP-type peptidyl-prolyl cis-trans isomerase [Cyclobacteriaceae bacterium]
MFKFTLGIFLILSIAFSSCDSQPNFGGPIYDEAGNLALDRVKIENYLLEADYDSLYRIHDPSGVVVIVQEEGNGSRPKTNNTVYINYVGKLLDGTVFDTNLEAVAKQHGIFDEEQAYRIFSFPLASSAQGGPIPGFNIGFSRLRSGSKAVLIIPSPYAYRDRESEDIPANSVLVFEVDFLGMD